MDVQRCRSARITSTLALLAAWAVLVAACGSDLSVTEPGAPVDASEPTESEAPMAGTSQASEFEQVGAWNQDSIGVEFGWPNGLTLDADSNVYSTEFQGGHIRKFTPDGDLVWESGGDGTAPGMLSNPIGAGVAADGTVYVSESGASRVSVFGADGAFRSAWGQGGSGPGEFQSAMGIDVSNDGEVFVADFGNNRVQVFASDGAYLREWGSFGTAEGEFNNPIGVRVGPAGNVWVVDSKNARIQVFTPQGEVVRIFDSVGGGPEIISVNNDGEFYVSSPWVDGQVRHFSADGEMLGTVVSDLQGLHGTVSGENGVVYVAQTADNVIRLFRRTGN